jgi:hypothetical protein
MICCAIQDQTVVIYAPLNFLGRAKNLFIGCIFFNRYVGVFQVVTNNLFYSIETLSNGIRAVNICFFRRAFFKNLCYQYCPVNLRGVGQKANNGAALRVTRGVSDLNGK